LIDFNLAYNISRQGIKSAKYITTTFAYHSTTYLFNECDLWSWFSWKLRTVRNLGEPLTPDPPNSSRSDLIKFKSQHCFCSTWNHAVKILRQCNFKPVKCHRFLCNCSEMYRCTCLVFIPQPTHTTIKRVNSQTKSMPSFKCSIEPQRVHLMLNAIRIMSFNLMADSSVGLSSLN